MCVVSTKPKKTVVKINVPDACTMPGRLQEEIDNSFDRALHDADRPAMPCEEGAEIDNHGLTRREMLAGMALSGILSRGVEPVAAAAIAVKAADAVLLLSQTHDVATISVTPAELIAAIYPGTSDRCRCGPHG